MHSDLKIL